MQNGYHVLYVPVTWMAY